MPELHAKGYNTGSTTNPNKTIHASIPHASEPLHAAIHASGPIPVLGASKRLGWQIWSRTQDEKKD